MEKKTKLTITLALAVLVITLSLGTAISIAPDESGAQIAAPIQPVNEEPTVALNDGCKSGYKSDFKVGHPIGVGLNWPFGYIDVRDCDQITFLCKYQTPSIGNYFRIYFKTGEVLACYDQVEYGTDPPYLCWLTYDVIGEEVCLEIFSGANDVFDIYYYASS